jgi:hypothetical protein
MMRLKLNGTVSDIKRTRAAFNDLKGRFIESGGFLQAFLYIHSSEFAHLLNGSENED